MSEGPKRRWFRFSLRTLFVVVTVLCVALGIVLHRARMRREAIRAIDELGGGYGVTVDGPAWLRALAKDDKYFYNATRISFRSGFTDDALAHVIDHINTFKGSKTLDLSETDITDDGLRHLYGVRDLTCLRLVDTAVTDFGLVNLEPLVSLQALDIWGTKVTDEGIARFQRSVPACRVQH